MSSFRWLSTLAFSFVLCLHSFAQHTTHISGKVVDDISSQPLPYANIYFNNTAKGGTSDSLGRFEIRNVPIELSELIVSLVGYKTLKADLTLQRDKNLTLELRMVPDSTFLNEVVVAGKKNKEWTRQFEQFKKIFIGTSANAPFVDVVNPYVLEIKPGETSGSFVATTREPLILDNRAMGYRLLVSIEKFSSDLLNYSILVKTRFEPLTPSNAREENRWRYNRMKTYNGSIQHLFKSIKNGKYAAEGFRIFKGNEGLVAKANGTPYHLVQGLKDAGWKEIIADSTYDRFKIFPKGIYQINYVKRMLPKGKRIFEDYPFPVSWLDVEDSALSINSFGALDRPANLWRFGYFDSFRMADMLPLDFDPFKEESDLLLANIIETGNIRGVVKDEHNTPMSGVFVFINHGLEKTFTDEWGQFELPHLMAGRYPIAFTYSDKATQIKNIDVSAGKDQYVTIHLKERAPADLADGMQDKNWPVYKSIFERKLLQQKSVMAAQYRIVNPNVLLFKHNNDSIDITTTAPLVIEHSLLGYRWTYFIDHATLHKRNGFKLNISGAVSMENLAAENTLPGYRYMMRQFDEYEGSWNHFATSLAEARIGDEGFETYINRNPSIRPVKFKTAIHSVLHPLPPDSIFMVTKGNMFVKIPEGLEIHSKNKSPWVRFYRGYSKQVMRITSDTSAIKISRHGITSFSDKTKLSGIKNEFLKRVPVDYKAPFKDYVNENILLYLREENLKKLKNLLEKVYVQTDRPYYYPGDTLWMKSYMKYQNKFFQDSLSKVLYVELISPQKQIISSRTLKIEDGQAWGEIGLPSNLPPGDYFLRAYTNWMCNFDEFFIRPVPVLARGQSIITQNSESRTAENSALSIVAKTDQQFYKMRSLMKMKINVLMGQTPVEASMSISVTEVNSSPDIEGNPTILSLDNPFKSDGSRIIRINRQIEKGITFYGKVKEASSSQRYSVTTVSPTMNMQSSTMTEKGGRFRLTLDFADTARMILKAHLENGSYAGNVEITGRDSVKNSFAPTPLKYTLANDAPRSQYEYQADGKAIFLEEVEVRAKKISGPAAQKTPTERRMIVPPHKIVEGDEVSSVRVASYLPIKLATFIPSAYHDETGFYSSRIIGGRVPFQFYLNDTPIPYSDIRFLTTSRISRIEIFRDPVYVISIYEEPFYPFTPSPKFDTYLIKGYDIPSAFIAQNLEGKYPEDRSTMYWNPNIATNEYGEADISFHITGHPGNYKITIEGISSDGIPFRIVKFIEVVE